MHNGEHESIAKEKLQYDARNILIELVLACMHKELTQDEYNQVVEDMNVTDEQLRTVLMDDLLSERGLVIPVQVKDQDCELRVKYTQQNDDSQRVKKKIVEIYLFKDGEMIRGQDRVVDGGIAHVDVSVALNGVHSVSKGTDSDYRGIGLARLGFSVMAEVLHEQGVTQVERQIDRENKASISSMYGSQRLIGGGSFNTEKLPILDPRDSSDDFITYI